MKSPTVEEKQKILEKLANFIGKENSDKLLSTGNTYIISHRVFYTQETPNVSSIPKSQLLSIGTQLGKFTKSGQFHLTITSIAILAPLARHKVWVKSSAEMNFLYGNDVVKAHVLKMSDDIKVNNNVFVLNENDLCLGFGVASKGSNQLDLCDKNGLVVVKQADCGEYLRDQETLFC